eukprot:CAMPEP_0116892236 /NCGR_PEP_ID=MMETSP0467-20121206/2503_1 /TAXON_ID=283647 /ORGANISM="Mesodinium pulex, Strain SPMC105" /LENGTH=46 /DNA_ID= /DNA_START= /DNA_END= /DNA_ORIENTATION=
MGRYFDALNGLFWVYGRDKITNASSSVDEIIKGIQMLKQTGHNEQE